jgi:hypothetical protein
MYAYQPLMRRVRHQAHIFQGNCPHKGIRAPGTTHWDEGRFNTLYPEVYVPFARSQSQVRV